MPTLNDPRVSIVIPNLNGLNYLKDCISSVLSQRYMPFEIIVVDNGSTDGSIQFLRSHFPTVKIIALPENIGFAGGCNRGVIAAKGEWIVLLNNDTVAEPAWLEELVGAARPEDVAVVGSRCPTRGVPEKYYEMNGTLNVLGYNIMGVFEDLQQSFHVSGCAVLFKKEYLAVPFDDDYFLYSEDVYLAWRARLRGYRVIQAPASIVYHVGSATTSRQNRSLILYYQQRNRVLNLLLFYEAGNLLKIGPFLLVDFLGKIVEGLIRKRGTFLALLKGYVWIMVNVPAVLEKRRRLQSERQVPDQEIVRWMVCQLVNGKDSFSTIVNRLSWRYCRLVGIRTVEFLR